MAGQPSRIAMVGGSRRRLAFKFQLVVVMSRSLSVIGHAIIQLCFFLFHMSSWLLQKPVGRTPRRNSPPALGATANGNGGVKLGPTIRRVPADRQATKVIVERICSVPGPLPGPLPGRAKRHMWLVNQAQPGSPNQRFGAPLSKVSETALVAESGPSPGREFPVLTTSGNRLAARAFA